MKSWQTVEAIAMILLLIAQALRAGHSLEVITDYLKQLIVKNRS
jgi:hypothetical protein